MQRKVKPKACNTSELGDRLARQLAIYACRPHSAEQLDNQGSVPVNCLQFAGTAPVNKIKSCSAVWIAMRVRKSFVRSD